MLAAKLGATLYESMLLGTGVVRGDNKAIRESKGGIRARQYFMLSHPLATFEI